MRNRGRGLVLLVGIAAAIAPGCGGSKFTTGGDGADAAPPDAESRDDAAGPFDSGVADGGARVDAGSAAPCPKGPPATGASCAPEGLECEYGSSPVPTCDTVATCQKARWSLQAPASGDDCPSARSSECPSTFGAASLEVVVHCDPFGLVCDYPTGRCACTDPAGPVPVDASAAARWHCQDPDADCPRPRPPLGSACTSDGLSCDYGSCTVTGGSAEKCADGLWQTNSFACAL
jgi:hypothetical protein